jgi:DNA-binding LacI/PurR family transcriptional regulator
VKDDVRRKVLNYIEEIGWRCNSLEQRLQLVPEGKAVVFIAPSSAFESRFNSELLRQLMERLPGEGYAPVVYYGHCRENLERALASKPYAVVIAAISDYQAPLAQALRENGSRVIGLGDCDTLACPLVGPDVAAGAAQAVRHLRKAKHRRIGFLGGMGIRKRLDSLEEVNIHYVRQLLAGICEALPDFSLAESAVSDCFSDLRPLRAQLQSGRHTAWICSDEKMCRQFLHCTRAMRLRIPEDVSLVAFTPDLPWYAFEQNLTRLVPDNARHVQQIVGLLSTPMRKPERKRSRYLFHAGGTVGAPR